MSNSSTIHIGIIKELHKDEYRKFRGIKLSKLVNTKSTVTEIVELNRKIKEYYSAYNDGKCSDILSTKVLLGIFGCIPAYDKFFKIGCSEREINPYSLPSFNSIKTLINTYAVYTETLDIGLSFN